MQYVSQSAAVSALQPKAFLLKRQMFNSLESSLHHVHITTVYASTVPVL